MRLFTQRETEFLQDPLSFSKRDARQYRYAIRKSVRRCLGDLRLAIEKNETLGLDIVALGCELENLLREIESCNMQQKPRPSKDTMTASNPFSDACAGWGAQAP